MKDRSGNPSIDPECAPEEKEDVLSRSSSINPRVLLFLLLSLLVPPFAFGDQDAAEIVKALVERLDGHLGFDGAESTTPREDNVDLDAGRLLIATYRDCTLFDPTQIEVVRINKRFKILQGPRWLFDFGGDREHADLVKSIIQFYGVTRHCYIGRPNPPFSFFLVPGERSVKVGEFFKISVLGDAPQGKIPNRSPRIACRPIDPEDFRLTCKDERCWLRTGSWIKEFDDRTEALATAAFINLYGFERWCFFWQWGGKPTFEYFVR